MDGPQESKRKHLRHSEMGWSHRLELGDGLGQMSNPRLVVSSPGATQTNPADWLALLAGRSYKTKTATTSGPSSRISLRFRLKNILLPTLKLLSPLSNERQSRRVNRCSRRFEFVRGNRRINCRWLLIPVRSLNFTIMLFTIVFQGLYMIFKYTSHGRQ